VQAEAALHPMSDSSLCENNAPAVTSMKQLSGQMQQHASCQQRPPSTAQLALQHKYTVYNIRLLDDITKGIYQHSILQAAVQVVDSQRDLGQSVLKQAPVSPMCRRRICSAAAAQG
jgi:hypothetical protein